MLEAEQLSSLENPVCTREGGLATIMFSQPTGYSLTGLHLYLYLIMENQSRVMANWDTKIKFKNATITLLYKGG